MSESLGNTWRWCKRYITMPFLVGVCYIMYVMFFNDNDYSRSSRLQDQIDGLRAEIKLNTDSMNYYLSLSRRLNTDPVTLECIVREQYHMQRPNEDVYIFE